MKKLVIGLVIGLMLGMSTNAFAAIGDTVSAVFSSFNYVVNGTDKAVDSPVLVYDGVSYVRTTDIGNMLGFDVTYKSDSRTIAFNGGTQVSSPSATPMPSTTPTSTTVTGDTYGVTPEPSAPPAPGGTVSTSPTSTPDPNATPAPTVAPTPEPTPTPNPALPNQYQSDPNGHALYCQSLPKDSIAYMTGGCN